MEMGQVLALALALGFLMGWLVGWLQGSAKEKQLTQELKWATVKAQVLQSDLEKIQAKNSEWAKEKIQAIRLGSESRLAQERSLARLKESGWELPQAKSSE